MIRSGTCQKVDTYLMQTNKYPMQTLSNLFIKHLIPCHSYKVQAHACLETILSNLFLMASQKAGIEMSSGTSLNDGR